MRYCYRKTLQYTGMIVLALILYSVVTLLWSSIVPWKNYQWNNNAVHSNGTIMQHEVREFLSQDGDLYAGYILVNYNSYWSQLCVVEDNLQRSIVEQVLNQNYTINSTVVIYYQSSSPSDPHIGPRSILSFIVWCIFNVVIFMGLMTSVMVMIYRDHKRSFHPAEHIRLYANNDIKLDNYSPQTLLPQLIPASYNL